MTVEVEYDLEYYNGLGRMRVYTNRNCPEILFANDEWCTTKSRNVDDQYLYSAPTPTRVYIEYEDTDRIGIDKESENVSIKW